MKTEKLYWLWYMTRNGKHYCSGSCQWKGDNGNWFFEENLAGQFTGRVSARMIKDSQLPLQRELIPQNKIR